MSTSIYPDREKSSPSAAIGRRAAGCIIAHHYDYASGEAVKTLSCVIDRKAAQVLLSQSDDWRLVEAGNDCRRIIVGRYAWQSERLGMLSLDWDAEGHYIWDTPRQPHAPQQPNCADDLVELEFAADPDAEAEAERPYFDASDHMSGLQKLRTWH